MEFVKIDLVKIEDKQMNQGNKVDTSEHLTISHTRFRAIKIILTNKKLWNLIYTSLFFLII